MSMLSEEGRAKMRAAILMWIGSNDCTAYVASMESAGLFIQDVPANALLAACRTIPNGELRVFHEGRLEVDELVDTIDDLLKGLVNS